MTKHTGGCHCGNIEVEYDTDIAPEDTEPRACQCSFCRQHQSRAVSDPNGSLRITVEDGSLLSRYQFAMKTIEFLVCRNCGIYVAGFMPDPTDDHAYATLMISALDNRTKFPPPVAKDYDAQSREARAERRRNVWTPATLTIRNG
ncbi:MAG: aldehyde-activating protein [Gammaproteobacteria bacterium]|nr:aldehyde-activating protein [Gammaproteobacteria bacterium]